jgi:hypothetical protein
MMGLTECADTIVGSPAVRGVSGGQRRRVSVAEMLMGNPRALLMDEITSGLDASTAFSVCASLGRWATLMRGSVTMALQQPAPEIVDLCHRIILMREGHIVFSGSQTELRHFVREVTGKEVPRDKPIADWALNWLSMVPPSSASASAPATAPAAAAAVQTNGVDSDAVSRRPRTDSDAGVVPELSVVRFHIEEDADAETELPPAVQLQQIPAAAVVVPLAQLAVTAVSHADSSPEHPQAQQHQRQLMRTRSSAGAASGVPALGTVELVQAWQSSAFCKALQREEQELRTQAASKVLPASSDSVSAFTRAQLYQSTCHSSWRHLCILLQREWRAVARNDEVIWYRVLQAIVMGSVSQSAMQPHPQPHHTAITHFDAFFPFLFCFARLQADPRLALLRLRHVGLRCVSAFRFDFPVGAANCVRICRRGAVSF